VMRANGVDEARLLALARDALRIRQYVHQRFAFSTQVAGRTARKFPGSTAIHAKRRSAHPRAGSRRGRRRALASGRHGRWRVAAGSARPVRSCLSRRSRRGGRSRPGAPSAAPVS
jgi:hypothetical protein